MRSALRRMGNSTGLIVPRPLLAEIGIASGAELELSVEDGRLVATPVATSPRLGWAEAAAALAASGDDAPVWPDLANDGDASLQW